MLKALALYLMDRKEKYYEVSYKTGATRVDSWVDIEGGIGNLFANASLRRKLPNQPFCIDGEYAPLSKEGSFIGQHILVPKLGVTLHINAFNFPAWGLWEKAAPALLSGMPVIVKPATATAWLTQRMVQDVVDAGVLPVGALSVIAGSSAGLMDQLQPFDVVSFTGSAETAGVIRAHPAVAQRSVRANIEADSLNSALLLPGEAPGSEAFNLLVREVVREMTVKSGQKCTAIRRILVPADVYDAAAEAIGAKLAGITVGNPRNDSVRMGSLVSWAQLDSVREGLATLLAHTQVLHDGRNQPLVDADPAVAACMGPVLLGARDADAAQPVHDVEVFGPVATLLPYRDSAHAIALAQRGQGSLVTSLYGSDEAALAHTALAVAASHGRVHVVTPDVAQTHSGHGNVMPMSQHGGPGRAGGGAELGGLRALDFYHQRSAMQASPAVLAALGLPDLA